MFNGIRNVLVFLAWWLVWFGLHLWLLYSLGWELKTSLIDSFSSTILLALLCFSLSFTVRFYRPGNFRIVYLFVWAAILSLMWTFLTRSIVTSFTEPGFSAFYRLTIPLRLITGFLIMSSFISFLYVFFGQLSREEQQKLQSENERIARETELSTLRNQLQPHFLFNTLNSIHALVGIDAEQARKMVIQLSDFLRLNLQRDPKSMVTFEEELRHLSLYLDIEKVRFGHRLKIEISAPEDTLDLKLPSLLLQPLIENAIKYGLYGVIDEVTIKLDAVSNDNHLCISIVNPFDPEYKRSRKGTGFGQNSVKRRLFLLYGRNDLFTTEVLENIYKVSIKIPQA